MHLVRRRLLTIICGALALSLPLFAATACGGDASPADTPSTDSSATVAADLVLLARPRLIGAWQLDEPGRTAPFAAVRARPSGSGEDLLVDLRAGRKADLVEVCSDESAERLAREGLLQPLDTGRIEYWDRIYPALKDLPGVTVDGKVYMVPMTASVIGILYDPATTPAPPDSFGDLFSHRYKGRLGFADDAALAFQITALDLGLPDPAALTSEQALEVEASLERRTKAFRSFWRDLDNLASAFKAGRVTAAVGDRRAAIELRRRGVPVAFTLASEGQPLAACGLAITSQAQDVDAAYALIDALLQPDGQAALATATGDAIANRDAEAFLRPGQRTRLGLADLARLPHPVARVPELEHIDWIQAWYEVKTGRG